jgi:hypothetical protein
MQGQDGADPGLRDAGEAGHLALVHPLGVDRLEDQFAAVLEGQAVGLAGVGDGGGGRGQSGGHVLGDGARHGLGLLW